MELSQLLKSVPIDKLLNLFKTSSKNAFRIELLEQYTVENESIAYQKYLDNGSLTLEMMNDWVALIKSENKRGLAFSRVRYIREPLHKYTEFEIVCGYSQSVPAGENIYIITGNNLPDFKVDVPILKDFWLFDDEVCLIMEYDILGKFLGLKELPKESLPIYLSLKKHLLEVSIPITNSKYSSFL